MVNLEVETLIENGNNSFVKNQFEKSINFYTEAIQKSNNKSAKAYTNRAAAYLKQNKYFLAYNDAQAAIQLDNFNVKAFFRAGKSAYYMRQFETALNNYLKCLSLDSENREAQRECDKTKQRLLESTEGNFDLESLAKEVFELVSKRQELNFDLADFLSNKISLTEMPNKSKGVIANEFIKKGTLLCASKALSAVFKYTSNGMLENTNMVSNLISKMAHDPYLTNQVYSLYPGPAFKREPQIDIDQMRIRCIGNFNSFKINLSQFKFNRISQYVFSQGPGQENQVTGLWYFPSFLNHSCIANVSFDFLGDMLFLFAKKDIEKNEEICVNYFGCNKSYSFDERTRILDNYGFTCDCKLCELDRRDKNLNRREEFVEKLAYKNLRYELLSLKEVLDDVKSMEDMYVSRPHLRHGLVNALQNLACRYRCENKWKKSAETFEKIYMIGKETCEKAFLICMLYQAHVDYVQCFERKASILCKKRAAEFYGESQKGYFEMIWSDFSKGTE